ncbi:GNAT family N-acetyltransferase [Devosia sp.]|uniref:GNAT family N-acetyltransferase n=1 Tax=Devosia sp. TaxID=1871048 RepID=UPI002AFFC601|nr:GNAT family N-acetyltransferase [Devosia sp.]
MTTLDSSLAADLVEAGPRAGSVCAGLSAAIVRDRAGLDTLLAAWTELEASAGGAVLFQGGGWARAIFDFETERGNIGFDPVIATLHDGPRLVAVLPLERVRTLARRVLMPLGHAFGQYSDMLVAPGVAARPALAQLLDAALAAAPADGVSFLKVRADSRLARGLPERSIVTGVAQQAPYVGLEDFEGFPEYYATIKAKTRKNMRNARNRLERSAPLTHEIAASPEAARAVVARTLDGRARRLRQQGLTSRAFRDGDFARFCLSLPGRADLPVLAFSLRHGDRTLAEQWGFSHQGRYYAFVASRDFADSDESPGKLHLGQVIEAAAGLGLKGVDLMVPTMPYKRTWATASVGVADHALAVTARGWLVLMAWDRYLRPLARAAVLALPDRWRSRLMALAGARVEAPGEGERSA